MKKDIVLIGAGGHCKSCIDVIEQTDKYNIVGIVDKEELKGNFILGYEIKWTDDDLEELSTKYNDFVITIGQIETSKIRKRIFEELKNLKVNIPSIISPLAYVSKHSTIGEGTMIFHGAIVNAGVTIGNNCIINTKSLIEHDSVIGSDCHISTNTVVNGGVDIGNNVFVGSGSVTKEAITIVSNVIVGGASFIRKSIQKEGVYSGNPTKKYK
ncbi:MAG: acetyltransferase [Flavobacteriaceae bacterium]|nr:acetyltransferase [Flavobacteriaceae bacterium]